MPEIHAASLFPSHPEEIHFRFYEELVRLVIDLELRIYRIGYYATRKLKTTFDGEGGIVGLCFMSMLLCLKTELAHSQIWPVMEIDQTPKQDRHFAGLVQRLDHATSRLGSSAMSIDNENLGELLYTTKRSAHGAVVDCMAYLLHQGFLRSIDHHQTPYKSRLADIASGLKSMIIVNETIDLKIGPSP
jgi:hypothetical protein